MVADFGMKVAHLGVLLHVESVAHVSADAQSCGINGYHSISCWPFKYMQLGYVLLGGHHDPKLT